MSKVIAAIRQRPVEVYGLIVAIVALVAVYVDVPVEPILGVAAAVIAVVTGRAVQKMENAKTEAALHTWPDVEAGE